MKLEQTGRLAPKNKPWKLIRDAVADLTLQEKTLGIKIDMLDWHMPYGETCHQCLGGAVISRRLGVDTGHNVNPYDFPGNIRDRLDALDYFRTDIWMGLKKLGYKSSVCDAIEEITKGLSRVEYGDKTKSEFKAQLLELADILEANLTLEKTLRDTKEIK